MLLVLEDGFWRFDKPLQARAENQKVFEALQKLAETEIREFVSDDRKDLAPYGLAAPSGSIQLFFQPEGEPITTIEIGSPAPDPETAAGTAENPANVSGSAPQPDQEPEELVFVSQPERDAVYTMPAAVAQLLSTAPNDLRDRSLLGFPAEVVNRILIRRPGQDEPVILELQPAGWFVKTGPEELTPAHQAGVRNLLKTLAETRVREFLSEVVTDADRYGLAEPAYELELQTSPERLEALRHQLAQQARRQGALPPGTQLGGVIQAERLPNEVHLAFSAREEPETGINALLRQKGNIVRIDAGILDQLYTQPFQWRSLVLFTLRPERLQRLEFQRRGAEEVSFQRGDDGIWQSPPGAISVNPDYVEAAADVLSKLRALDWVAPDQKSPEETYGFQNPTLTVRFTISGEDAPRELVIGQLVPQRGGYFASISGLDPVFLVSLPDFEVLTAPLELAAQQ
jgi:hypothetical protein